MSNFFEKKRKKKFLPNLFGEVSWNKEIFYALNNFMQIYILVNLRYPLKAETQLIM